MANLIVGVRGTVATDAGVLVIFDVAGAGQVQFGGQGKGGGTAGFHGQGVEAGKSGVRLVGALGRDQTYVSRGILHTRKAIVGEEVSVREQCLVQGLALALEVIG